MRNYNKMIVSWLMPVCIVIIAISCSAEKKNYNQARSENTIASYDNFLKDYPDSKYNNEILELTELIYYNQAKEKNTVNIYSSFLDTYPKSQYKDSIDYFIEKVYYTHCINNDTLINKINFLKKYPDGYFTNDVKKILEGIGRIIKLTENKLVTIDEISNSKIDHCWLKYKGFLEPESDDKQPVGGFEVWHMRDGVDSKASKVDVFVVRMGSYLDREWKLKFHEKGQQISFTQYDAYGRATTTHVPVETAVIKLELIWITLSESEVEVIILPGSNIVSRKE